jgi:hypothetical protein
VAARDRTGPTEADGRFEDLRAAFAMDGAVDATTPMRGRIRRVDDGVDVLLGDVAPRERDAHE